MSSTHKTHSTNRNNSVLSKLDSYFEVSARGSSFGTEIRGGIVTFLSMVYIVALNPIILGQADTQGTILLPGQVAVATALAACISSILMGIVGKLPASMAAGLGISAVVVTGATTLGKATWADIMGLVVIEGIIILLLVVFGLRKLIFDAIDKDIRNAIGIGIGLFICLIGFGDSGFVTEGKGSLLTLGANGAIITVPLCIFVGTVLLMMILTIKRVKGAILLSMLASTILSIVLEAVFHFGTWVGNVPTLTNSAFSLPDLSLIGQFNLLGSFSSVGVAGAIMFIFTIILSDFFDTMGTVVAITNAADLNDSNGEPRNIQRIFIADSIGASLGGVFGISSNTVYVESASGVADGARTGLAAVVTGILFGATTFASPYVTVIPHEAVTPALVLVGFLMMTGVVNINWSKMETAVPAFLIIVAIPFTYSITNGIGFGILAYVIIKICVGKFKQLNPLTIAIAIIFLLYFAGPALAEMY
jgi:AGZA family xanthine/uracil permease-like MFS transporter